MSPLDDWIEAGAIVRPHGIKGEVVVEVMRDLSDVLEVKVAVRVTGRSGDMRTLVIERSRDHKARKVLKFEGIGTVEDAESLRGSSIWLRREQVGPLEEGRWFVQDIIGLEVHSDDGVLLGELVEVMHMPANDVYVVRSGAREILLPAIDDVVKSVDLGTGTMIVHMMEGLE